MKFHPTKRDPLNPAPLPLVSPRFLLILRVLANTRLVVVALTLLVVSLNGSELGFTRLPLVQILLAVYLAYAAAVRLGLGANIATLEIQNWAPWVDLFCFGLTLGLSGKPLDPIFFLGFLFVIVGTSWTLGRARGLIVTSILSSFIILAALVRETAKPSLQIQDSVLRSALLFAVGCAIAYLAGLNLEIKRQARLLDEVTTLSNPRLDVGRTIGSIMERVRTFYDADFCLLIGLQSPVEGSAYFLRSADRTDPEKAMHAQEAGPEIQKRLLALPPQHFVLYRPNRFNGFLGRKNYYEVDVTDGARRPISHDVSETIAKTLDVNSFISIPVIQHERVMGRVYLGASRSNAFHEKDASFLSQILDRVLPVLQNVLLVNRLASEAADQERKRIACDIHDSVIQPYLGIQLGLASIRDRLKDGNSEMVVDIDRLIELTAGEVSNLRRYASGIPKGESEEVLLPAIRRFAEKFSAATGISVGLNPTSELKLNDRLAVEVLQMVQEGLSNIRRHTSATKATVDMGVRKEFFTLRIANEDSSSGQGDSFYPRSIAARTAALGGTMHVDQAQPGTTAVVVTIPL